MATDFSADAIIVVDADMKYSSANDTARKIFPGLVDVRKGSPVCDVEGWPEALTGIDTYIGTGKDFSEIEFDHIVEGEDRCYQASAKSFSASWQQHDTILGIVIMVHDVTTAHRLMMKLEEAAATDGLTGLYNRRHFMEVAGATLMRTRRMGTPCSILMLDLDKFKRINDKFGHLAGDEVLRYVARQMKSTARIYDIFARYGGEEFVALIDGASLENARQLAERIRKQVESSLVWYEDAGIKITCSIGVAEAGEQDERIDDILRRADAALYKAKDEGRNRVCVSD
jgi:diguanylate cyclase (GGDEF)-like protein